MVTAEQAKNMRSGINIEGTVERKGEPRTVNMKSGGTKIGRASCRERV